MKKGGGYLLSRIALQYHRRKLAYLLCSEWEEVGPHRNNHLIMGYDVYRQAKTLNESLYRPIQLKL